MANKRKVLKSASGMPVVETVLGTSAALGVIGSVAMIASGPVGWLGGAYMLWVSGGLLNAVRPTIEEVEDK